MSKVTPTDLQAFEAYILKRALHMNRGLGADMRCNGYLAGARAPENLLARTPPRSG